MLIARHHIMLPEGVPKWVHLLPSGTFTGVDGRGPFKLTDPQAVITASMAPGKLAVDENHATDLAATTGAPSPARGWIIEIEARADGLWGRVDWTPSGTQLMTEGAYRGVSPVFECKKDGTVLRVLRAALTNTPNLADLHTLHHQETGMDLARLRAALGLPETADEAAILAAVTSGRQAVTAHSRIAQAAGLAETVTTDHLVTVLNAQRAGATEVQTMATTIVALQSQVTTMQAAQSTAAATAFVDGAIKAGAPIAPLRAHYIARHMIDATAVETEINGIPKLNVTGTVVLQQQTQDGDPALSAIDMNVAQKMGIDPVKFAAFKKTQTTTDGRAA